MRLLAALLLSAAALVGEEPAEVVQHAISLSAAGGMSVSLSSDRPSEASGGVRMRYEAVRLESDRLSYRLAAFPGASRPVLVAADLLGGPAGPADGRILFDSSASTLPQMAFRGVLRPRQLTIRRSDPDPAQPKLVRFRVEAIDLGDLAGLITTPAGQRQHVVWADRAVIECEGEVAPGSAIGISTPRLTALHLYGRAARDDAPARPSVVLRLAVPVAPEEATVERLLPTKRYGMRASGMVQTLLFDAAGNLSSYQNDTGDFDMLDGEDLIPRLGPPSAPSLKP